MVTAFANSSEVLDVVTPDVKHAVYHSKLVFIDLNDAPLTLGGSALAQVFDQIGDSCPSVDLGLLQRAFRMIQALIKQQLILAGHDRSDGGVITTLLEMCFAGDCGADITIPEGVDWKEDLFNEGLGWVIEVDEALCEALVRSFHDSGIPAVVLGTTTPKRHVTVRQGECVLLDEETLPLREEWERTSYELELMTYNKTYVEMVSVCVTCEA